MSKRVVTTALCIIPPKECWKGIQDIREKHDQAYKRWMPHINLVYPFVPVEEFIDAEKKLIKRLAKVEPFTIKLENFDKFSRKGDNLVFFDPKCKAINDLFELIDQVYPGPKKEFHPHMTVAQFSKEECGEAVKGLVLNFEAVTFDVTEIYMISRVGLDGPMEVRSVIPLSHHSGTFVHPAVKLVKEEVKLKRMSTVFVANMSFDTTKDDVLNHFKPFGCTNVTVPIRDGKGRGFAFVEFGTLEMARKALLLDGSMLSGRAIRLEISK